MAEGQFVLRARAGPALEEAVSFLFVSTPLGAPRPFRMPYGTVFPTCSYSEVTQILFYLLGWLQCLWDAVIWGRPAIENNSLLAVFVYGFGRVLSAVLCL